MSKWLVDTVFVGHEDSRRTIYDVVPGDMGIAFYHISAFDLLIVGNYIGRHYHKKNSEIYYIISGEGVMHFCDIATGEKETKSVGPHSRAFIPPGVAHELVAMTDMVLIIVATSKKGVREDTFSL